MHFIKHILFYLYTSNTKNAALQYFADKLLSITTSFGGAFFRRATTRRQRLSLGLGTARVTVSIPRLQNNNQTRLYYKKKKTSANDVTT